MTRRVMDGDDVLFPTTYLCAENLKGRDVTVTIKRVAREEAFLPGEGKKGPVVVLYFEGTDRGMTLNKTNSRMISEVWDQWNIRHWPGLRITLYPTTYKNRRSKKQEPCIRVRNRQPPAKRNGNSVPREMVEDTPPEFQQDDWARPVGPEVPPEDVDGWEAGRE